MKKIILILPIMLFFSTAILNGRDFITINLLFPIATLNGGDSSTLNNPLGSDYGTANGKSVIIYGTSSQPNMAISLSLNGIQINSTHTDEYGDYSTYTDGYGDYSTYTDGYGNWQSPSYFLGNGTYTLTASLITPYLETLALSTATFTVNNEPFLYVNTPTEGSFVFINPIILSGTASLANATINISCDGTLIASTTTDGSGSWQYSYILDATNGAHTFLIELIDSDYYTTIASSTVDVISNIPLLFPTGTTQARIVEGDIPTSGSGSGPGYIYTVSGSIMTINFTPAFPATPSVQATGFRSSGSSTVTLASVSPTALSISFSTGTQTVHFAASLLR